MDLNAVPPSQGRAADIGLVWGPTGNPDSYIAGFHNHTDISVRLDTNPLTGGFCVTANSLADLTKRENRFAHGFGFPVQPPSPLVAFVTTPTAPTPTQKTDFPFDARRWGPSGMPTLRECSASVSPTTLPTLPIPTASNPSISLPRNVLFPQRIVPRVGPSERQSNQVDLWTNPYPWTDGSGNALCDAATGDLLNLLGPRVSARM